jgi:secreted Zn-dependent insulinase-like peptidase
MVFMGSKKYPGENHYDSFITSHGGSCNAFTEGEYTVYQFDVDSSYFSEALDIFGNCFIAPVLSKSATDREINAIESEFNLAKSDDGSRLQQLLCHQAQDGHVLRKFSWGNANSLDKVPARLGVDVHSVLRAFHSKHYTASNMKLVVMASKPLEELEKDVSATFSEWNNPFSEECLPELINTTMRLSTCDPRSATNLSDLPTAPAFGTSPQVQASMKKQRTHSDGEVSGVVRKVHTHQASVDALDEEDRERERARNGSTPPPVPVPGPGPSVFPLPSLAECLRPSLHLQVLSSEALRELTRVVPIKAAHTLMLTWALPAFCREYRSKPCNYIGHLLGHEGPGSLLSALKRRNLATSLAAGVSESNTDDNSVLTMFEVSVSLTEQGLANWIHVAHLVHEYLRMLREHKPQKRIFDEIKQVCNIYYRKLWVYSTWSFFIFLTFYAIVCIVQNSWTRRSLRTTASACRLKCSRTWAETFPTRCSPPHFCCGTGARR